MSLISPKLHKLLWDLVAVAASAGVVYGTIQYLEYVGPWKTLVMVLLMLVLGWLVLVLGWLAVTVIYPLWWGHE